MQDKLDYVVEQIGGINKTLEFQSKQLETHIKRTELMEARMEPVEDHVKFTRGLIRVVVSVITLCTALITALKTLGVF